MKRFFTILYLLLACVACFAQQGGILLGSKFILQSDNDSSWLESLLVGNLGGQSDGLPLTNCFGETLFTAGYILNNRNLQKPVNQYEFYDTVYRKSCPNYNRSRLLSSYSSPFKSNHANSILLHQKNGDSIEFSFGTWMVSNDSTIWTRLDCTSQFIDTIYNPYSYKGIELITHQQFVWNIIMHNGHFLALKSSDTGIVDYNRTFKNGTNQNRFSNGIFSQLKANNTGDQLVAIEDDGNSVVNLYQFDKVTGAVSFDKSLLQKSQLPSYNFCTGYYESVLDGIAFSQNDSIIYIGYTYYPICNDYTRRIRTIYQIDRFHPNPSSTLKNVFTKYYTNLDGSGLRTSLSLFTARDGIIYWGEGRDSAFHTIENANVYGSTINYFNRYTDKDQINNLGISTYPSTYKWTAFDAFNGCSDSMVAVFYGSENLLKVTYLWGDGDSTVYDSGTIVNGDQSLHVYDSSGTYTITQRALYNDCGYTKTSRKVVNVTVPPSSSDYTLEADTSCTQHTISLLDTVEHTEMVCVDWGDSVKDTILLITKGLNPISISHTYTTPDTFMLSYKLVGYGIPSEGVVGCTRVLDTNYVAAFHPTPQPAYTWSTNYIKDTPLSDTAILCVYEGLTLSQTSDSFSYFTSTTSVDMDTSLADKIALQLPSGWHQTILTSYTKHGCQVFDTFTVGIAPRTSALWKGDTNVCENTPTTHGVSVFTFLGAIDSVISSTPIIYKSTDSLLLALNGSTVSAYTITTTAFTNTGCIDTFKRTIHVRPLPSISLTGDSAACINASVPYTPIVTSVDSSIINWYVDGTSKQTSPLLPQNEHIDYFTSSSFPVRMEVVGLVSTMYGCVGSDTAYTDVFSPPDIVLSVTDIAACLNEQPISLTSNTLLYESTDILHAWGDGRYSSTVSTTDTVEQHQHRYDVDGSYTFTSIAQGQVSNCTDTSYATITIHALPEVSISGDDACEGDQGSVVTTWRSDTTLSVIQTFADNLLLNTITQPSEQGTSGVYYLPSATNTTLLSIVRDTLGCSDSSEITTRTLTKPLANYTVSYVGADEFKVSYLFEDKSVNHTSAELYYGDGFSDGLSPSFTQEHTYADTGTFSSYLIVSNEGLCLDTAYQNVLAQPFVDFYIPTSITPNADGLNDYLSFSTTFIQSFQINLYNRWGENVMRIGDVSELVKTSDLPIGVYAVSYGIIDIFNNKHYVHQTLTVLK